MVDGNGDKLEQPEEKTVEQLAQDRLVRYQANPDTFVEIKDIIFCVLRNPNSGLGLSVVIGHCKRSELDIGLSELQHNVFKWLMRMDMEAEIRKAGEQRIVTKGAFGLRRR